LRVGSENMENLMTVVERLDELQASSVGRRECSSIRQRTGARRMDVHVNIESALSTDDGRTLCRHVTICTTMVIFCCLTVCLLTVFDDSYTVPIV